ncbi:MAG: metallophosphoesterase [Planctomycetes bacterium]|nr:metallophosphoesterase [Planctomycetota bacterium]
MEGRRFISDIPQAGLSRRQLLRGGLALAAWTLGPRWTRAGEPADVAPPEMPPSCDPECTRWALLSDTHIAGDPDNHYRGFYPYRNLQEVTAQIAADLPDGVVITGDLARLRGQIDAYENLKALLGPIAEQCPIHLGLGNHDDRNDFFRAFGPGYDDDGVVANKHVVTTEAGPVRLIVLDSLLNVNWMTGKLGPQQRTWLETALQSCDDRPTILFLHHTLNGELLDMGRLFEIIKPVPKIKAVVYGHSHKYNYSEVAGIHLINLPATGFNLARRQPVGWVEARLMQDGGEFTLHAIGGHRENDGRTQTLTWRS